MVRALYNCRYTIPARSQTVHDRLNPMFRVFPVLLLLLSSVAFLAVQRGRGVVSKPRAAASWPGALHRNKHEFDAWPATGVRKASLKHACSPEYRAGVAQAVAAGRRPAVLHEGILSKTYNCADGVVERVEAMCRLRAGWGEVTRGEAPGPVQAGELPAPPSQQPSSLPGRQPFEQQREFYAGLLSMVPCDLFRLILGRTLWIVGDR